MTTRQRVLVFVLAGFSAIAGVAGFGWLVMKQVRNIMRPVPMTEADKRLLITASDLVPFGIEVDPRAEKLTSTRQFDGTRTLQYAYEPGKLDSDERISLQSFAFVQNDSLSARQMFTMQKLGVKTGMKFSGGRVKTIEAPELFRGGDDRYAAILKYEQSPVGNMFVIRQGRVVHSIILAGMSVEDPEAVQQLFEPMLAESKRRNE